MSSTADHAVAIIGVGAILPDAPDAGAFWDNVREGHYAISDVDPARWDPALYYDADPQAPGEDLLEDRRVGARLGLESAGLEAADPAQGRRRRWTTARSGPWPARAWRSPTRAGPSAPLDLDRTAVILGTRWPASGTT